MLIYVLICSHINLFPRISQFFHISALLYSCFILLYLKGGTILERFIVAFPGEAVLSPIMNGLGGNLAAVNASRVSTAYHTTNKG